MMAIPVDSQAPMPPPAYHRAQVRDKGALHIDALTLVRCLHLLALCRVAVRLACWRCPHHCSVGMLLIAPTPFDVETLCDEANQSALAALPGTVDKHHSGVLQCRTHSGLRVSGQGRAQYGSHPRSRCRVHRHV